MKLLSLTRENEVIKSLSAFFKKFSKVTLIIILLIAVVITVGILRGKEQNPDFQSVGSKQKFMSLINKEDSSYYGYRSRSKLIYILTLPWSLETFSNRGFYINNDVDWINVAESSVAISEGSQTTSIGLSTGDIVKSAVPTSNSGAGDSRDFSTTNIQVENVDEADIIKTDGNYIYSLVGDKVVITDAHEPSKLNIASEIQMNHSGIPNDILLYENKVVVIGSNNRDTVVNIFDTTNKMSPQLLTSYFLDQEYYTSRVTGNNLYVMSTVGTYQFRNYNKNVGSDEEGEIKYTQDQVSGTIPYDQIYYLANDPADYITTIAVTNLEKLTTDFSAYFMRIDNAYVSTQNIYLLGEDSSCGSNGSVKNSLKILFGPKGPFGWDELFNSSWDCDRYTTVNKFAIKEDKLHFVGQAKESGETINQFSVDEHNGFLRLAMNQGSRNEGAKVVIWDENMKKVGSVKDIAPDETMYSSRFIGDRAYLVTFRNTDPLFAIDVADPYNPKILGELKIPGYSTYLHPYDDNHLIGIGMQTEEDIRRDSVTGRVISSSATITGMKMALFDVTNPANPRELFNTTIGDRYTTSAILTNHKALLFSKEKNLLAIPINNYEDNFTLDVNENTSISSIENFYAVRARQAIAEGYLVYDINLQTGFTQKGVITHATTGNSYQTYYGKYNRLLRGLYIDNDLYAVSQVAITVNDLSDLSLVGELAFDQDYISQMPKPEATQSAQLMPTDEAVLMNNNLESANER